MQRQTPVMVIGAGLAGSELALQLSARGIPVRLFDMKPSAKTPAQVADHYAELVCSNSFRASGLDSAVGVIKEEMRLMGGRLMGFADAHRVPAGGALAVDRTRFGEAVTEALRAAPNIDIVEKALETLPSVDEAPEVVVATGPLTTEAFASAIQSELGARDGLYFYDAIAPIVDAETVDMDICFRASRYGKGDGDDYLNCPMDEDTYVRFITHVLEAEKVAPQAFEEARYFEGCLPIEVLAVRGLETLRFGAMKPVGLCDPRSGQVPHAVVQLRAEDVDRTAYNLVGFQTRMKWPAQTRVFRMIPGLEHVEFLRMGSVHRNTYIDSPTLLDEHFCAKAAPHIRFAGQITGVEGYVESTASGLLVSLMIAKKRRGEPFVPPPRTTALGALYAHTLGRAKAPGARSKHVPSNVHWGLCPSLSVRAKKRERKRMYGERALRDLNDWWAANKG